jgi:hypothetical protein
MQANNILSITRLGLLARQGFIHNARMIGMSVVGFCGILFLVLIAFQASSGNQTINDDAFSGIFLFVAIPLAIVYTGTAFPGLRSKEKSYSYLLTPASAFEKFLFEFINRVLLFFVVIPVLYWIVFHLEGRFMASVGPEYTFWPHKFVDLLAAVNGSHQPAEWAWVMPVFALLLVTIPFAGAASFTKYPLPKTLFIVGLLFFFNFLIGYLLVTGLRLEDYNVPHGSSILFIENEEDAWRTMGGYGLVINAGLLVATYFKLKEKEV